ncbi:Protoheme IX farnesyltransferase, mitochondrial [Cladophialophora chaetospira]|uniref:Protoheme IX farnesyltransferase, mitochondrial n=1 Tax=Cladophialophora chaetospira TaxID=386627 RepID=A0AA39CE68_9EURO|nr:Protoheme IX farnesyltransferase, mitochondrial [Cladophialophora chaetospira]
MAAPAAGRLSGPGLRICPTCLTFSLRIATRNSGIIRASRLSRKLHSGAAPVDKTSQSIAPSQNFIQHYFSANTSIERGWVRNGILATVRTIAESSHATGQNETDLHIRGRTQGELEESLSSKEETFDAPEPQQRPTTVVGTASAVEQAEDDDVLPHRKRRRRKETISSSEESLPLDASSQLTTAATAMPTSAFIRRRMATYLSLSKPRLSLLVVLTASGAYSLYPIPDILSSTALSGTSSFSTSTLTLLFLTSGTFLSSACANTLNMLFEQRYDALMSRTRNRPLVRKLISPRAAATFALLCGASGLLLLGLGTNPTVAGLSALNIILYAGVYTRLKRISAVNTWVGAIVGGIPPMMGWLAAAGDAATSEAHSWQDLLFSEGSVGGWLLAALLFAWQFPHFMSLSHTIRDDYKRAGHQMLAWTNPARNGRVALRYSIAMFPICGALYWTGYVDSGFLAISTACNVWMTREAYRFWKQQGAGGSARGLFWASVWQLPLVLVGALVCKRGLWDGFFGTNDTASIYEEQQLEADGETLGMDLRKSARRPQPPDLNMAMIGFKRPT